MVSVHRAQSVAIPLLARYLGAGVTRLLFGILMMTEAVLLLNSHAALASPAGAHDFTFKRIEGGALPLADYRGKTLLLVNTASQCGFTGQYAGLQDLWDTYRDRGLVVIGVPSDDFGGQEPGTAAEIKRFCTVNFNVNFPITDKVRIKGEDAHPYYQWVAAQGQMKIPRWNFYKHLIDGDGNLVDWFASTTRPDAPKLIAAIEKQLDS